MKWHKFQTEKPTSDYGWNEYNGFEYGPMCIIKDSDGRFGLARFVRDVFDKNSCGFVDNHQFSVPCDLWVTVNEVIIYLEDEKMLLDENEEEN